MSAGKVRRAVERLRDRRDRRFDQPPVIDAMTPELRDALADLLDVCADAYEDALSLVDGACDCPICLAIPKATTIADHLLGTNTQEKP